MFRITIPALDRLMDYLEGNQQREIDALNDKVAALTTQLAQHRGQLAENIAKTTGLPVK